MSTGYLRVNEIYTVVAGMASQIVADASGANFMALWDCCSQYLASLRIPSVIRDLTARLRERRVWK